MIDVIIARQAMNHQSALFRKVMDVFKHGRLIEHMFASAVIGGEIDLEIFLKQGGSSKKIAKCLEAWGPRLRMASHHRDPDTLACDPNV